MRETQIIDGKAAARTIRETVRLDVASLREKTGKVPHLSVVLVGDNPASQTYVRNKARACEKAGIESETIRMGAETTQEELLSTVRELNENPDVDGILVQLPLPSQIDEDTVTQAIDPAKDVDGFHEVNMGRLLSGQKGGFVPCTPAGIMKLLELYGVSAEGKECVVIGRSNIVGKPVSLLLLKENGTVTICHSHTRNLSEVTRRADILVAAVGKPHFVTSDMIKEGAVVIDVGINRVDGKLQGDVDTEACMGKASLITPVPGGVGPMTIAMLLVNTLEAFKNRHQR